MAEIKTGIFAKNVQKRLNRAQEKVSAADGGGGGGAGGMEGWRTDCRGLGAGWRLQACLRLFKSSLVFPFIDIII